MFDTKSDYSLNKSDPEAIVCRSADGVHIRLTRENFDSDEEFLRWKNWSDDDYHTMVKTGRGYDDNCISLIEAADAKLPSAEEVMLAPILEAESAEHRAALLKAVRSNLTNKQYRRLRMYYLDGMTEAEIARHEGVGQPRICNSLNAAKKAAKKIFHKFLRNRG